MKLTVDGFKPTVSRKFTKQNIDEGRRIVNEFNLCEKFSSLPSQLEKESAKKMYYFANILKFQNEKMAREKRELEAKQRASRR